MDGASIFSMIKGVGDAFGDSYASARKEALEAEAPTLISNLMQAYKGGGAAAVPAVPGAGAAGAPAQSGSVAAAPTFAATGGGMGDYLATTRAKESGGNDAAANPSSTALGRYQFTKGTWAGLAKQYPDLGLTPDGRTDPAQQERAMQAFTRDNAQALTSAGITINPQNLYGAHFLGAGGATKFIPGAMSSPDVPAASLVGPGVTSAGRVVFFNRDGSPKTAGEVYAWMGGRRGGGSAPAPAAAPVQVASAEPDAANIPAVGAQPAGFVVPQGGAPTAAPSQGFPGFPAGAATRMTPELQTALNAAWRNPQTRAMAGQIFGQLLKGGDTPWEMKDVNGQTSWVNSRNGQILPIGQAKRNTATVGNSLVDTATGDVLFTAPDKDSSKFTYQAMPGVGMVALHSTDPTQSRVIIAGQQPRPLSAEERQSYGIPEGTGAGMGPDGKPFGIGGARTQVNVDTKGAGKFAEKANEHQAKRYSDIVESADQSVRMRGDVEALTDLGAQIATGRGAQVRLTLAQFAKAAGLDGVADGLTGGKLGEMEAFGAIADRLTPQMRVPGSGATSDMEMRTFRNAIPSLLKTPEGNKIVSDTFRGLLDYQAAAGDIAGRALRGEMDQAQADQALRALPGPFERFKGHQRGQGGPAAAEPSVPGAAPKPADTQPAARPRPGSVSIPMGAARDLKALPDTPQTRAQFDDVFGEGASASILGPAGRRSAKTTLDDVMVGP